MSVFDLNTNTTGVGTVATGTTGSVVEKSLQQEGSGNGGQQNSQNDQELKDNGKKIILDGPLSEIYTKALNAIYSKDVGKAEEVVGQESQQMDAVLVADIHKMDAKKKAEQMQNTNDAAYVYVTDDEHLKGDGLIETFDNVRVALDMQGYKAKVLCIECKQPEVYHKVEMLANMARNMKVPVFYTRNAAMKYIQEM